ncbi:MAG TPA: hypothetical protein VNN80_11495 [Polyangiaceae bacterium]|nr:hypothetical protein [Polyangiaceae bacterium]
MKLRYVAPMLALTLPLSRGVSAQDSNSAAAEALFREAREQLKRGELKRACQNFVESQRLEPATGTLLAVANCNERQGKLATAWDQFSDVIWRAQQENRQDRATLAQERADALEPRLSVLTLDVPAALNAIAGLTVTLDGEALELKRLELPIFVDGGRHVVEVSATGHQTKVRSVEVRPERDRVTLVLPVLERPNATPAAGPALAPSAPLEREPSPAPADAASPSVPLLATGEPPTTPASTPESMPASADDVGLTQGQTAGVALGIAGAALLTGGAVALIAALVKKGQSEDYCTGDACEPAGLVLREDAVALGNWATGLGIGGALLGGIGLALWLGGERDGAAGASLSLGTVSSGLGLSAEGRF